MSKRYFLTWVFVLLSLCVMSQKHMKFMGIPIDGSAEAFCKKLESLGLEKDGEFENSFCFKGKFYGEEASIDMTYDPETMCVYEISVFIVKKYTVYPIQRDLIKALEEKYEHTKKVINPLLYQYAYYIYDDYELIGVIDTYMLDHLNVNMMLCCAFLMLTL